MNRFDSGAGVDKNQNELMDLLFTQSLSGIFFMMLEEPVVWNEEIDQEKVLDYVFEHQQITRINQAMLDQYRAEELQMLGLTPGQMFSHDMEQGRRVWKKLFDEGRIHVETDEKRLDGSSMAVQGDYICLYDERGRITGHFGIQVDISEIRHTETVLIEEQFKNDELERFFSVNPDLMSITDRQARFLKVNKAWESVLGYTVEELKRLTYLDLVHPEDKERTRTVIRSMLAKNQPASILNRCRCKDGTYRYLEWHAHPYEEMVYGTARDITEKIETEEFIEREKELFNTALNTIGVGILVTDDKGRTLLMNPKASELTGWDSEEAFLQDSRKIFRAINMDTKELTVNPVDIVLATGDSIDSGTNAGILSKNGTEYYISGNANPIASSSGLVDGVVVSFRDVTQEYSLQQEMEGFLNVNLDMFCIAYRNGTFYKVNKKFLTVIGYSAEEVIGRNIAYFLHPDEQHKVAELQKSLNEEETINEIVTRVRCGNGAYKYIEWNVMPGAGDFIYASARDITQKIMYEDELKEQAIKDELTGLYNRHYLDLVVGEITGHADHEGESLSFLLLDFDHFKLVNDTWGHPVGDDVLRNTAALLQSLLRERDILIRMGGEEFAAVLPDTGIVGAQRVAEKLRQAVENFMHSVAGKQTISIGVAERMRAESFRHWYRRSDEALYHAKQNGRNCVVASDPSDSLTKSFLHIDWIDSWESGNEVIDFHHKELVEVSNSVISNSLEGSAPQVVMDHLSTMIEHVSIHFTAEEDILLQLDYPKFQEHRQIHRQLIQKALELKDEMEKGEVRLSACISFIMDDVIMDHMIKEDTKFFAYTRNAGSRKSSG